MSRLFDSASTRRFLAVLAMLGGMVVAGHASAGGLPTPCPDKGSPTLPGQCYKEVRILNNTTSPIYVVVQGSIIGQAAIGCALGDVWLQRALGITNRCLAVKHDYYIYMNPATGIAPGKTGSISLPWWSKRPEGSDDLYVDWWRSGRLYIFDDPKALADIYDKVKGKPQLAFAAGSPKPTCNAGTPNNACANLGIWQVPTGGEFGTQTPAQLNEYTFASVNGPDANPDVNFALVNLNQNYNVSNVDQAYLPLAMEPIRASADIGYMGTTITVAQFRANMKKFAGTDANGDNPTKWPVYNNPKINGTRLYPRAGIRVPSMDSVLSFYQNPYFMGGDLAPKKIPQLLPYTAANPTPPTYITNLMTRWQDCTKASPVNCPKSGNVDWSGYYKALNTMIIQSYNKWLGYVGQGKCTMQDYLKPKAGSNPQVPANKYTLMRYVYAWVPFNVACQADVVKSLELPSVDDGSKLPLDYVRQQYDYQIKPAIAYSQVFNPYTPMVHNAVNDPNMPGLASNAYAFSIDDLTAFQTNAGTGLIFAVGGDAGLPNKNKVLPTVPVPYQKWDINVSIAPQEASNTVWTRYGICSSVADKQFPRVAKNQGFAIGVDPAFSNFPCDVTLQDSGGVKYTITLGAKTQVPPKPIWPTWLLSQPGYDKSVVTCKTSVNKAWCQYINERALATGQTDPTDKAKGPIYSLSTRGPLAK